MKHFLLACCCTFYFSALSFAQGSRIYVKSDAAGANTGQNWANAFKSLKEALDVAGAGDSVWVAAGKYTPVNGTNRNISFNLKSKVRLFGGFSGTETAFSQRNWAQNTTILSGDIGVPGDSTDNSFTILYMENPDLTTVIDGFRFEYGIANDTSSNPFSLIPAKCGGAIFIQSPSNIAYPDILNCTFYRNYALYNGGAVYVYGDFNGSVAPRFINCTFEENKCGYSGAAVNRYSGSMIERAPDFGNCRFVNNVSGGYKVAVLWTDGIGKDTFQMEHCVFEGNTGDVFISLGRPTGLKCRFDDVEFKNGGPAVNVDGFSNTWVDFVKISNCRLHDNNGAALQVNAADAPPGKGKVLLEKTEFIHNYFFSSPTNPTPLLGFSGLDSVLISDCRFVQNTSNGLVAAAYIRKAMNFDRVEIIDNKNPFISFNSQENGTYSIENSLYERNNFTYGITYFGGSAELPVRNCSFVRNVVSSPLSTAYSSKLHFQNCIFWKNQSYDAHIFKNHTAGVQFEHCYFDTLNTAALPGFIGLGVGNHIGGDPGFVDTNPGGGDYRLQVCSPLINQGSAAGIAGYKTDLDRKLRIQGGAPDLGAYERPVFNVGAGPLVHSDCAPGTATVQFAPAGGCAPYNYAWAHEGQSGTALDSLMPGLYNFTITDAAGQQLPLPLTIPGPMQFTPVFSVYDCSTSIPGNATLVVEGGAAPYTFEWGNGLTDSILYNLGPGSYPVTVTDHNGCQDSTSVRVARKGLLNLWADIQQIRCSGEHNGAIEVHSPANVALACKWSSGATMQHITGLSAGAYSVTAVDGLGCRGYLSNLQIVDPAPLYVHLEQSPASGPQSPDGSVRVDSVSGGWQPYQIKWSNGASGDFIGGLKPGLYSVTVTDASGCETFAWIILTWGAPGTDRSVEVADFRIYPNPASDRVHVVLDKNAPGARRLLLRDVSGRVVRDLTPAPDDVELDVDVSGLGNGVYWVECAGVGVGRVVVLR